MSSKSSRELRGVGQDSPALKQRRTQEVTSEYWSFRLTSSKVPEFQHLLDFLTNTPFIVCARFQLESGSKTGQEHYQGVFHTAPKKRASQLQKMFADTYTELLFPDCDYLEPSKSAAADRYVMKDDTRVSGPWEFLKMARHANYPCTTSYHG